jgi:hypothetical protein
MILHFLFLYFGVQFDLKHALGGIMPFKDSSANLGANSPAIIFTTRQDWTPPMVTLE